MVPPSSDGAVSMTETVHGILIRIVAGLFFAGVLALTIGETGFADRQHAVQQISADHGQHHGQNGGHAEHGECDHALAATCAAAAILAGQSPDLTGPSAPEGLNNGADTERADGLRAPPLRRPPRTLS